MGETELVFVDANIFLEVLLQDKRKESCKMFLSKVISGEIKAVTSDFIIYACLLELRHKKSLQSMKEFIVFINECHGLSILRPSLQDMNAAIEIANLYKLDFDDGLVVACMILNGVTTLISLDKDFDRVKEITRKEPIF